jgi:hypothetical protein
MKPFTSVEKVRGYTTQAGIVQEDPPDVALEQISFECTV